MLVLVILKVSSSYVVLYFQNQTELTELSSFLSHLDFVLGSGGIRRCFFPPKIQSFLERLNYRKGLLIVSLFKFFLSKLYGLVDTHDFSVNYFLKLLHFDVNFLCSSQNP